MMPLKKTTIFTLLLFSSSFCSAAETIFNDSFESNDSANVPIIAGCQILPEDNLWNTPIDNFPLHPNNIAFINSVGGSTRLHADFGSSYQGRDIGIPYTLISDNQTTSPIQFLYWDESDLNLGSCNTGDAEDVGCYPIPANPNIEGGSDKHILLLQQNTCMLYEIFHAQFDGSQWTGGSGAIWDLSQNQQRPETWTSADASGLAILPGLIRYDEIHIEQEIKHAIRFTLSSIRRAYILPATHSDGQGGNDPNKPPMGLRLRLKASFDISSFAPELQIILIAMKKYGIILADTGSDMYITGEHHDNWNNDLLHDINQVRLSDFEAVYSGDAIPY